MMILTRRLERIQSCDTNSDVFILIGLAFNTQEILNALCISMHIELILF